MSYKKLFVGVGLFFFFGAFVLVASAEHSWNGFHWGRTANPFTLQLVDSVTSDWNSYLGTASADWSASTALDTVLTAGSENKTTRKRCPAVLGKDRICNAVYGNNGWLGLGQVWVYSDGHIAQSIVKLNDTYFNTSTYNTPAWRNLVMCQEVGHTLGLDHQDETFTNPNLGTCMDYTNDPSTNQHPNQHDYDQLEAIYAHIDSVNTIASTGDEGTGGNGKKKPVGVGQEIDLDDPSAWGKVVKQDAQGKNSLYVRHLGDGEKLFTFVVWAR